ncbi:FAD/NAD(P)-binding protein [Glarea lozoyensis ATCC 20868]|uniref:FAD/NAD(P)-binding protein n=1 Tax=Glarea lozoyensis (strain ATCC 20868 / MF5171) TaxID=1116229 RepID=S3DX00_GLAL2|nr:FAD/NAD(P)-binding protein [Glarea lozoyensis ATCC 20868]EPE30903.1 FAD/NAD(P)-binding protein [Glarea lozoyensis ATCC 20868]
MAKANNNEGVTIIGAGLAGLSLALSLKVHSPATETTLYELREPTTSTTGALMLSPNALRILDTLGVYSRIKQHGYEFEILTSQKDDGETTDTYAMGSESLFGYKALRVYRQVLLEELRGVCKERGINIVYGLKFSHVVLETPENVTFALTDGTKKTTSLLIGTDGIHSQVRKYLFPDITPIYSGITAVTASVSSSSLRLPCEDFPMPISRSSPGGVFVMAPQNPSGTDILVGTQTRHPELSKEGWGVLRKDRSKLMGILTANKAQWSDFVQSAMEGIDEEHLSIWPFYVVPHLQTWASKDKRVVIMGDAAHAIPPTAGQGASQAFEDVYSFSYLLSKVPGPQFGEVLPKWQEYRMERVKRILELTRKLNNRRLPAEELNKLSKEDLYVEEGKEGQGWLFDPKIEEAVEKLIAGPTDI